MRDLDWKILKVLNEKESITQTAQALFLTQSALTKRIRAIEDEWKTEVVIRTSKGVIFTEDGRYLADKAAVMLDFLEEITEHYGAKNGSKEFVRIGVPNSFARLHMPKLMKGYMKELDALQFKTVSHSSDHIVKQLIDETIDMGIVCGDYNYLGERICLFDEDLFMVTPKGVSLEHAQQLPFIESYLNPLVKSTVDQWWKRRFCARPQEVHSVPYPEIAIEMVENGLGLCFVFGDTWKIDRSKTELIPIRGEDGTRISRNVWMMLTDHCFKSRSIMDFVTYVEKYYQVA